MTNLIKYDAARQALAEATQFDEVKDLRDKAEAMAAYARQAKDSDLIEWATEIKVRAERRCGEMLREAAESGQRVAAGRPKKEWSHDTTIIPTLNDLGVTKDESSRYQRLAAMPAEKFEAAVESAKQAAGQVTTARLLREARPERPAAEKEAPESTPAPTESEVLRQKVADLMGQFHEQGAVLREAIAENEEMGRAIEADDAAKQLLIENKRLREENRVLKERINGLMNEKDEAVKSAKYWKRKAEATA